MDRTALAVDTPSTSGISTPISDASTIAVVASFRLSDAGRKSSLLAGGNGRQSQTLTLTVPTTRLHLVQVDADGVARLRLRPQFQTRPDERIVRVDDAPEYDAPPSAERLLQDAARNHQLEAAYRAQGVARRATRDESSRTWRDSVAVAFLADPERRALPHPSPTSRRCVVPTDRGRLTFDSARDRGAARDVPREAQRRFVADLHAHRARVAAEQQAFRLAHGEKTRLVHAWIAEHGSADQRERLAAGVLPLDEGIEAMAAVRFRALDVLPPYRHDGAERLQGFLRTHAAHGAATVAPDTLKVTTRELSTASALQWAMLQQVRQAVPDAQVFLRERVLSWTVDAKAPRLSMVTVLAVVKDGPLTLRRECLVADDSGDRPRVMT
ncbi:MAG: hypothetical protein AB7U83_05035 [Vicinamibacterales bacterium]